MSTRIFGIRHHGPGSARKLEEALEAMEPDIVLIEGPPEGEAILPLAAHEGMEPPVAMLIYRPDKFEQAAYIPFAAYSPEWRAIQYALARNIPVRFIDLPLAWQWNSPKPLPGNQRSIDPLGEIAKAAGYEDGEKWWEEMIEQRAGTEDVFEAVLELMGAVRESVAENDVRNAQREAYMRQCIRKAEREMYNDIAVVCGAFHSPALEERPKVKDDTALLKGFRSCKTEATWIPWTYERLSQHSGYGAGVTSPSWYELVYHTKREALTTQWMVKAAHVFREEGQDTSPGHVVEGVRLAEALSYLRGKDMPGLEEFSEAVQAIMCFGDSTPLELLHRKLIIGEKRGTIPESVPVMPLQRDVTKLAKKLRLKMLPGEELVKLDLRKPNHLEKSQFLHRLNLLGVTWGAPNLVTGKSGTFHEEWTLDWQPECEVQVLEAATWGNTVEAAAENKIVRALEEEQDIPGLTHLLQQVFLADLSSLVEPLTIALHDAVALGSDIHHLMEALPPLVNLLRYGNVRQTASDLVEPVVQAVVPRITIGLPAATRNLSGDHANQVFGDLLEVHAALRLLEHTEFEQAWLHCLQGIAADYEAVHGLIWGAVARILFEADRWDAAETEKAMSLALSKATEPERAAAWIEGFLYGSGLLLIHNPALFRVIDQWLSSMPEGHFTELLPLLRRTFAQFSQPERKQMGHLARGGVSEAGEGETVSLNAERVAKVLPVVRQLLNLEKPEA